MELNEVFFFLGDIEGFGSSCREYFRNNVYLFKIYFLYVFSIIEDIGVKG